MFVSSVLLVLAIVIEVAATAVLPRAAGFTHPGWTGVVIGGYVASTWLLSIVVRSISVSAAYAIWAGAGTALVAIIGVLFMGERLDLLKVIALVAIIGGIVVLNLSGGAGHSA